jgi:hypothetical protein
MRFCFSTDRTAIAARKTGVPLSVFFALRDGQSISSFFSNMAWKQMLNYGYVPERVEKRAKEQK